MAIIYGIAIMNLYYTVDAEVLKKENRKLNEKPELSVESLKSGDYFRASEEYFADTFLFRNPKTLKVLSRFAGVAMETCWNACGINPIIVPIEVQYKVSIFSYVQIFS